MTKRQYNIAVTGMGALIGQGIARSLAADGRARVIGVDRRDHPLGRHLSDAFEVKPNCPEDAPEYMDFWRNLVKRHSVDLILPGIGIDMYFLDAHRDAFAEIGCAVVLNDPRLISLTGDKLEFAAAYAGTGLPVIPSARPATWEEALDKLGPPPLLLKPRRGEGSQGIALLRDARDFDYWTGISGGNWMIQRRVGAEDEEFTVGTFGFGDGTALAPIIFRRRLTRSGHTGEAEVVDSKVLADVTARIATHFKPLGPTNLQFRLEGDTPYLLEINPRFSSSNSLRTAFGYNEAAMCIDWYLEGRRPEPPTIRCGTALRYNEDFVSYAGDHL